MNRLEELRLAGLAAGYQLITDTDPEPRVLLNNRPWQPRVDVADAYHLARTLDLDLTFGDNECAAVCRRRGVERRVATRPAFAEYAMLNAIVDCAVAIGAMHAG